MRFLQTEFAGAWVIEIEPICDHRGCFSRIFCVREFAAHGLETNFVQHSLSYSAARGTVRGMHFQAPPHDEVKIVGCVKGAVWDVIIDIRPASPTFGQWRSFELTAENRRQLYIPTGFAHGFQTLSDDTEVRYLISAFYEPSAASGLRHDDPSFAIHWPSPVASISSKDQAWPDFAGRVYPQPGGRVAGWCISGNRTL
jgi:dTDP-4-dehydrorhamnose 3,5-epimerase